VLQTSLCAFLKLFAIFFKAIRENKVSSWLFQFTAAFARFATVSIQTTLSLPRSCAVEQFARDSESLLHLVEVISDLNNFRSVLQRPNRGIFSLPFGIVENGLLPRLSSENEMSSA